MLSNGNVQGVPKMSATIPFTEAKAKLSSVIQDVKALGAEYVVTVRGVPSAMIVPIPKPAAEQPKAKGMLAGKRPVATREEERAAYIEALEGKYANPS